MERVFLEMGLVGMAAATLIFAGLRRNALPENQRLYSYTIAVTGIAAIAYLLMSLDIGTTTVGTVRIHLPRYVDWLLTTPLLLYVLVLIAAPKRHKLEGATAALLGADLFVIASGLLGTLAGGNARWAFFAAGLVAAAVVLRVVFSVILPEALQRDPQFFKLFKRLGLLTLCFWVIYPVVWSMGQEGAGVLSATAEAGIYMVLDLLTKVGYGFILLTNRLFLVKRRQVLGVLGKGIAIGR